MRKIFSLLPRNVSAIHKTRFACKVIVLVLTLGECHCEAQQLLWMANLKANPQFAKRIQIRLLDLVPPRLQFQGDDYVVVGFENGAPNSPRTLVPRTFELELVQFDSKSGKLLRRLSKSVVNLDSSLQSVVGGNLLLLSGESLQALSPTFEVLQSYATHLAYHGGPAPLTIGGRETLSTVYEGWKFSVAPNGKTAVLRHKSGKNNGRDNEMIWLETSDLSLIHTNADPDWATEMEAADDFVLLSNYGPPYRTIPDNVISECSKCKNLYIANNEMIIEDFGDSYNVVNRKGDVMFSGELVNRVHGVVHDLDESRVAFSTASLLTVAGHMRTRGNIMVLDLLKRNVLIQLPFDELAETRESITSGVQISLALSPDGRKLAVLFGSKLSCYLLP